MKPRLKSSPAARELIKRFQPYLGIAEQGNDGQWRVGYGHKAAARSGVRVTEDEASLLLIYDLIHAEEAIDGVISSPLSKPQRDALASFVHGVGVTAFKQSDVARYLFEGRAMAAGEAIALYGDGDTERREAESSLFLSSFAPPKRGPIPAPSQEEETVELVIKVEHPGAEDEIPPLVTESQAQAPAVAADAGLDLPPPPPPPMPTARREAEDEIARILASVGSLALADTQSDDEPERGGMPNNPVLEPELTEARLPDVETQADSDAGSETEELEDSADAAETTGRVEPDSTTETDGPADALPVITPTEFAAVPLDAVSDAPVPASDETVENAEASPPVDTDGEIEPENLASDKDEAAAEGEEATASPSDRRIDSAPETVDAAMSDQDPMDAAVAAFSPPVESAPPSVEEEASPEDKSAQVLARMNAEISGVSVDADHVAPDSGIAAEAFVERTLPNGTALGYVLAGDLVPTSEREEPQAGITEDATGEGDLNGEAETAADDAADEEPQPPAAIEDIVAERMANELAAATARESASDTSDVIETRVVPAGDDTPPPHPSDTPASANGAVGEVEVAGESTRPNEAVTGDDILASDFDPIQDEDLTPQDLAGDDVYVDTPAKAKRSGKFPLGYVLFGLFFGTIGALGWFLLVRDWQFVMANPQLTPEVAMGAFGPPLAILCFWFAISDFRRGRKQAKTVN